MKAEIITIGDELLIGQTVDTNSAWIGAEMSSIGFKVSRITSISDNKEQIIQALTEANDRSDVILITGGLGPTSDDITKPTLCEYFDTRLVYEPKVLEMIENMIARRKMPMNENNRRQAQVPESCRVLYNATGTAPGMWFEKDGSIFVSMPGVPLEMKHLMTVHVLPELKKRYSSQVIIHRNIMTYGSFEAKLAETLVDFEKQMPQEIKLAYLPSFGVIKLRLTGTGTNKEKLTELIENQVKKLYGIIPELIYGENEETLEMVIGRQMKSLNATLSTAESCTGGRLAQMITSVPGSSKYFKGSVIAYDNQVKINLLKVPESIIQKHGAVSKETVEAMAEGARLILGSDYAVSTSGIAGPDGATADKPVGTVWIAVSSAKRTISEKFCFGNDRNINIKRFSIAALNLLRKQLLSK